jgi:hypothetical protein
VVPVAVFGTEHVRRGWRIRPRKIRVRAGRPLQFPTTGSSSPALAAAVTERMWACVSLQWEWLGGERPPEQSSQSASATALRSESARRERERISDTPADAVCEKEPRAA